MDELTRILLHVDLLDADLLFALRGLDLHRTVDGNGRKPLGTFLHKAFAEDGNIDLEQSIYIDWGAFVNAIFQFVIVAFVLFCILKVVNNLREEIEEARKKRLSREQKKELRENGIKPRDRKAAESYFAQKQAKHKAEQEARAALERAQNPTSEDLLKLILGEMRAARGAIEDRIK